MLLKKSVAAFFSLICLLELNAQAPKHTGKFSPVIDDNINGFWEYLPRNYSVDTWKRYPLLIFIHGSGEQGYVQDMPTLNLVLRNGPPRIIQNGTFPDSFYVNGSWYKFIVISPQIKIGLYGSSSIIAPSTVESVIRYAKSAYRIDTTKIYVTGLSMGGGATWDYAGSSLSAASRLAAIIVACGAGDVSPEEAANIAQTNLPVLTTHNWDDPQVAGSRTTANVNAILGYVPTIHPLPRSIYWISGGHNVWRRTFENINAGSTQGGNATDTLGMNIYQWLLQFSRIQLTLPVSWQSFSAQRENGSVFLEWIIAEQESIKEFQVERSIDARVWSKIASVPAKVDRKNVHYTHTDNQPEDGKSFYRVVALDQNGSSSYSVVKEIRSGQGQNGISIYPNPFAERLWITMNAPTAAKVTISISDANGKLVSTRQLPANNSSNIIEGINKLPAGMYNITVVSQGQQLYNRQLVKE